MHVINHVNFARLIKKQGIQILTGEAWLRMIDDDRYRSLIAEQAIGIGNSISLQPAGWNVTEGGTRFLLHVASAQRSPSRVAARATAIFFIFLYFLYIYEPSGVLQRR